jgi:hypothetical protein
MFLVNFGTKKHVWLTVNTFNALKLPRWAIPFMLPCSERFTLPVILHSPQPGTYNNAPMGIHIRIIIAFPGMQCVVTVC